MKNYILKEENGKYYLSPAVMLDKKTAAMLNGTRIKILELLSKKPMYPSELAKALDVNEQVVYYHIKHLQELLEIAEKKEIRGTIARKFRPKAMNFALCISDEWKPFKEIRQEKNQKLLSFLEPFLSEPKIIVGSPDQHGPYKAAARDGHYATDLALFLGNYAELPEEFSVKLDVDLKSEKREKDNLIVVGGPGTNLFTQELNEHMPVKFDIKKSENGFSCAGIKGKTNTFTKDADAIIVRMPNPHDKTKYVLVFAGMRCIGIKTAIIGLTRFTNLILSRYSGQKEFSCILRGFDLDGDGKIDSVELLE